eukprot:5812-Eustigmatos_ZCMA.PRE.1
MSGITTVLRANGGGRDVKLLDVAGGTGEREAECIPVCLSTYVCTVCAVYARTSTQKSGTS